MNLGSLVLRMLCSLSRVNLPQRARRLSGERDFPKLTGAAGRLAAPRCSSTTVPGSPFCNCGPRRGAWCSSMASKLFVIDYLQLLHSTARRAENRQQEIADISNGIKSSRRNSAFRIVLSQLNRELEKDKSRNPQLSDLRESGAIEQDGRCRVSVYKPAGKRKRARGPRAEALPVNLLIAKQRNGPDGRHSFNVPQVVHAL